MAATGVAAIVLSFPRVPGSAPTSRVEEPGEHAVPVEDPLPREQLGRHAEGVTERQPGERPEGSVLPVDHCAGPKVSCKRKCRGSR